MISLALVALLMVALNTFVFRWANWWGQNTDKRLFEQHVRAVTRFLEHEMMAAALPPAGRPGQVAIAPQEVHPTGANSDNLLTFELPEGSRLIAWPKQPLPEVVCSLWCAMAGPRLAVALAARNALRRRSAARGRDLALRHRNHPGAPRNASMNWT